MPSSKPSLVRLARRTSLEDLRTQYTIDYAPKRRPDGRYRTLKVEATNPAFVLRYREGYLAAPR